MPQEIERKYLVIGDCVAQSRDRHTLPPSYLNSAKERTVRIRTIGEKAFLTIKSETRGIRRQEYEYPIPYDDAVQMLASLAEKTAHRKNPLQKSHTKDSSGKLTNSSVKMPD